MEAKAAMTERISNLVVPLAHEANDMRATDTDSGCCYRSGAVTQPRIRPGDVESTTGTLTPGIRTSTTANRTTTTRTTTTAAPEPSADESATSDFSFTELTQAYFDCRRTKRNTASALVFEADLEHNLRDLYDELTDGSYAPGRSTCFIITRPRPREVWAAAFRDRIVHHLLHNRIGPRFYRRFVADSCACITGRGTLYSARRLESNVRSITQNWTLRAYYLKLDLANFFVSIDKNILHALIAERVTEPWWLWLSDVILFHDPRQNYEYRGHPDLINRVPQHKRLTNQPETLGLPIGNLSSQFFANVYLDELDQFIKHRIGCKHYVRYVDDFVLLHESAQWLNDAKLQIIDFIDIRLNARLNTAKTILQPIERGIDFVGQVIKPWRRITRRKTVRTAIQRTACCDASDLLETANSYFGLLRQAGSSHHDRAELANMLRARGQSIKGDLTKTYRRSA